MNGLRLALDFIRRALAGVRFLGIRVALRRASDLVTDPRAPSHRAYQRWLADTPRATVPERSERAHLSLLCPVRDAEPRWLEALYESVVAARRVPWELRFVDDGSCRSDTRACLSAMADSDDRVHHVRHESARGISAATNAAAHHAKGEVFVFVDHDDVVCPLALHAVARAFAADPELELAYTDEDQITDWGLALAPVFKPGAAPMLALSHNYVGHLLALRRGLFERLGGLRSEFDGSQDHDLVLRGLEQARRVRHLPLIGYHWRRTPQSVARSASAKPWAFEAGRRAVEQACDRRGIPFEEVVHGVRNGVYRLRPARSWNAPLRARIVVHGAREGRKDLLRNLEQCGLLEASEVFEDAWPESGSGPLVVVDASLAPQPGDWDELLRWAALPQVGAVGIAAVANGRRVDLGYALGQDGRADAIFPGRSARALGPGLLGAGPREVAAAAGGMLFIREPAGNVLERLRGRPVDTASQLMLSLAVWTTGESTLMLPHPLQAHAAASNPLPTAASLELERCESWKAVRDALPPDFWEQGHDRFHPRHELLDGLTLGTRDSQ